MQITYINHFETNSLGSLKCPMKVNFKQNSSLLKESIKDIKLELALKITSLAFLLYL